MESWKEVLLSETDPDMRLALAQQKTQALAASIRTAADGTFSVFPYFPHEALLVVPLQGKPGQVRSLTWHHLAKEGFTYVRLYIGAIRPDLPYSAPLPSRYYLDAALPHPYDGEEPPPSELDVGGAAIWVEGIVGWLVGMELPPAQYRHFFPRALGIPDARSSIAAAVWWDSERCNVGALVRRMNQECARTILSLLNHTESDTS